MKKKIIALILAGLMIMAAMPGIMAETYTEGDSIWIKTGSPVYNEEGKSHTLWGNYKVTILGVKETQTLSETDSTMYEFEFVNGGLGQYWLKNNGYKYVAGENLTSSDPETGETTTQTAPECSCTGIVEENLSKHADSCERKTYVKTLFEGTTAEEIYANWDNLDIDLQNDLLDMLKSYDNAKYEELNKLIGGSTGDGGEEEDPDVPVEDLVVDETFEFTDAPTVGIQAADGVFPEGTEASVVKVDEVPESEETAVETAIAEYLSDYTVDVLSMDVMDISFANNGEKIQPQGEVYVSFDVDLLEGAEIVAIFHIDDEDGKAELMAIQDVVSQETMSMTIAATSFSHYVVLQADQTYIPTKMSTLLADDERYSIVTFPVTLNDFDAVKWNSAFNNTGFLFTRGVSDATLEFGANSGYTGATQGIVDTNLTNGYPVIKKNTSPNRGAMLFDGNSYEDKYGKTAHDDVAFQFIFDEVTGEYTYNSGANHAQYNPDTETVELYADTIAPYNYKTDHLSAITKSNNTTTVAWSDGNKLVKVNEVAGTCKFTINDDNMDTLKSDLYTHIYLRLKSSVSGTLMCRVFYNTSEDKFSYNNSTKGEDYDDYEVRVTAGEWEDVVFGAFDANKNVRFVRFYLNNVAAGNTIEIDDAGFLYTTDTSWSHGFVNYAGFYPFNADITKSYAGSEEFNKNIWESLIQSGENEKLHSSRTMFNEIYSSHALSDNYVYFTMAMEVDFYLPEDGKVNDENIIFNFNGDDDMWVFVDGELALDIGGAHTYVDGTIDFTTGETTVEKARTITDNDVTSFGDVENDRKGYLSDKQKERGTYHKMQIFYMERAGTNSNCLIKFNLPVVPTGDVTVTKELKEVNNNALVTDKDFEFEIKVDGEILKEAPYKVIQGTEVVNENGKTTENGRFTIEAGQSAIFADIDEGSKVTVTEIQPGDIEGVAIFKKVVANDKNSATAEGTTNANNVITFKFTNTYEVSTTLTIAKEVKENDKLTNPEQSFMFEIYKGSEQAPFMTVVLRANAFADGKAQTTIKDLPAGNYTVKELTDWSWRYKFDSVAATNANIEQDDNAAITFDLTYEGETVTYTNSFEQEYWLGNDVAGRNYWTDNGITPTGVNATQN